MKTISRKDAKIAGLIRYFTGKLCKHGHIDMRYVIDGMCAECGRIKARKHYQENKARRAKINKRWRIANKKRLAKYMCTWKSENRAHCSDYTAQRRAKMLEAMPVWVDVVELKIIYDKRPDGYHVDHIVPLKNDLVCGLHVPWNLQYLTAAENLKKGNQLY